MRWLLVEDRSAWGNDAVRDVLGAELAPPPRSARMRVLLVRRREGDPAADAVRRAILVDTVSREMAVRTIDDLGDIALEAVADAPGGELRGAHDRSDVPGLHERQA